MVGLSLLSLPAYAADDSAGDIGISVPVIGPSSTPAHGAPNGEGGGKPLGGTAPTGGGSGSGSLAPDSAVATDTDSPEPVAGDMLIAGGLYLSDIGGASRPTVNPFEGTADLWVTLRNLSSDTIDASADFSIATFTGARIDGRRVQIQGLKPGESRVVGTTLSGTGQWPFVVGRVTIDPPDAIAGQATTEVSRAGVVYVLPWLGLIGLVLVVLAIALLKLTTSTIAPTRAAATAA
jgi:hypothetical protein